MDEESELDRLYTAPLEQFVKLRNDLAGRLRKEGDLAAATRIGALKKPSVSAWVVNQLARTDERDVQRMIKAGEALEKAQSDAISGAASGGFEAARAEEAAAVRLLRTAAKQVLSSASPAILDRVTNTLRAAAATKGGRELIKQGRLAEDLEASGFEALSGVAVPQPVAKRAGKSSSGEQRQGKIETLRRRKQEADEEAKRLANEAKELEREDREVEELARKATRAAAAARKRADAAAAKAQSLEVELAALEEGA